MPSKQESCLPSKILGVTRAWICLFEKKKALSFCSGRTRQAFDHCYHLEILKRMESPWEFFQWWSWVTSYKMLRLNISNESVISSFLTTPVLCINWAAASSLASRANNLLSVNRDQRWNPWRGFPKTEESQDTIHLCSSGHISPGSCWPSHISFLVAAHMHFTHQAKTCTFLCVWKITAGIKENLAFFFTGYFSLCNVSSFL